MSDHMMWLWLFFVERWALDLHNTNPVLSESTNHDSLKYKIVCTQNSHVFDHT